MELILESRQIESRIQELAKTISKECFQSGNSIPPVFIGVLNGSFMFFSDLVKNLSVDCEIDFIRVKSYEGQDNSGGCKVLKDLELDLKGKNVYIIEDLIDTGETMFEVLVRVNDRMPASVKIVTLLKRRNNDYPIDHYCFEIGDEWVAGRGLDNNGLMRNSVNLYKVN